MEETESASLQFVRKIRGFTKPSKANEASFKAAGKDVAAIASRLLDSLETTAPPKTARKKPLKAKAALPNDSVHNPPYLKSLY